MKYKILERYLIYDIDRARIFSEYDIMKGNVLDLFRIFTRDRVTFMHHGHFTHDLEFGTQLCYDLFDRYYEGNEGEVIKLKKILDEAFDEMIAAKKAKKKKGKIF